jgi:hypothetical protein
MPTSIESFLTCAGAASTLPSTTSVALVPGEYGAAFAHLVEIDTQFPRREIAYPFARGCAFS